MFGAAQKIADFETAASDVLVSTMCGQSGADAVQNVLSKYSQVVDGLAGIANIVAHGDIHVGNLFPIVSNGVHGETVAIDWASCRMGAPGEDVGNLIAVHFRRTMIDVARFDDRGQQVFNQYLEGLLSINHEVDVEDARTGFLAGFGYWTIVKLMFPAAGIARDPEVRNRLTKFYGRSLEDLVQRWGTLVDRTLPYAVECIMSASNDWACRCSKRP